MSWLDDCARYALSVTAHTRVSGPIVLAGFPANLQHIRGAGVDVDRQRAGVHHPVRRRPRWPQRLRDRAAPSQGGAEELPAQPPHHLRQGGTVPANTEEVADRPTRPAGHHGAATGAAGPVRRAVQPAPAAPIATAPGHPAAVYTSRPKAAPGAAAATPMTGSAVTVSTKPARSPCATAAGSTASASAEPTPEPASSSSCKTYTSASPTPPPANCSASCRSNPTKRYQGTGRPPGHHPGNDQQPEPTSEGSALSDVLRHHKAVLTGFEPAISASDGDPGESAPCAVWRATLPDRRWLLDRLS